MHKIRSNSLRLLQNNVLFPARKQKARKFTIKNDSFHESVGFVLTIGQCFAQIPIVGVLDKNYRNVRFEMFSFRTIYATIFIALEIILGVLSLKRCHDLNYSMGSLENCLFITVCLFGTCLLYGLARKWQSLICFWEEHEHCFLEFPYKTNGMRLKTKINLVAVAFLLFAFIEHGLYLISAAAYGYEQFTVCKIKNIKYLNYIFVKELPHIFLVVPFNNILVVPTLLLNLSMTFCWNYVNLIIIVVSIGISTRFEQINHRLQSSVESSINDTFWLDIRNHYLNVVDILRKVDSALSLMVMLVCASNLYYVCLQLFHSFKSIPFYWSMLYFWYSLIFLVCRTLCVLLFGAKVHETSRKSIRLLRKIPTKYWTNEAQRFLDLVTADCNALSGKKFFYITKNVILTMVGSVVTYELVLFSEVVEEVERKSICYMTQSNFSVL